MIDPPVAPTAEAELISAVVLDPALVDDYELDSIPPEAFWVETNRTIWRHIVAIHLSDRLVDLPTLIESMRQAKELERGGGVAHITGLMTEAQGIGSNVTSYADMVMDTYRRRELMNVLYGSIEDAASNAGFRGVVSRLESGLLRLETGTIGTPDDYALELAERFATQTGQVSSGFASLDRAIGGFPLGDLTIVAGRTSMGKSAFIHNIAFAHKNVTVLSPDQPKPEVYAAQASRLSRVPLELIRAGIADADAKDKWLKALAAVRQVVNNGTQFLDGPLSLSQMARQVTRAARMGHRLVFVDHLQRIRADTTKGRRADRRELMIDATGTLKDLARQHGIAVVALSQLKREIDERNSKVPMLSDLSESKSIEEDANLVLFLYRQAYYVPGSTNNVADIIIAKHKTGSRNRSIQLYYEPRFMEFGEIADRLIPRQKTSLI